MSYQTYKMPSFLKKARNGVPEQLILFYIPGDFGVPQDSTMLDYFVQAEGLKYDLEIVLYSFTLNLEPKSFSVDHLMNQINYISIAIQSVMEAFHAKSKFSIVSHGSASMMTYLALLKHSERIPIAQLQAVVSLNGHLGCHTHDFSFYFADIYNRLRTGMVYSSIPFSPKVINLQGTLHLSIHGNADSQYSEMNCAVPNLSPDIFPHTFFVATNTMKNVFKHSKHEDLQH